MNTAQEGCGPNPRTYSKAEYDELSVKFAALEAELAKLRAGQEPVAMLCEDVSEFGTVEYFEVLKRIEPGTKLYTTPQPSAGVVMPSAEVLADLFVGCPLPKTVRVDQCALDPEYPHRFGTNLLTWGEAKLMFDEMLASLNGKEVGRG